MEGRQPVRDSFKISQPKRAEDSDEEIPDEDDADVRIPLETSGVGQEAPVFGANLNLSASELSALAMSEVGASFIKQSFILDEEHVYRPKRSVEFTPSMLEEEKTVMMRDRKTQKPCSG